MPPLGQAPPPQVAPGAAEIAKLSAAGFSAQDVAKYQQTTTQKLLNAGFTVPQVEAHWGTTPPHSPEVATHVAANMARAGVVDWGIDWAGVKTAWQHPGAAINLAMDELKGAAGSAVSGVENAVAHPVATAVSGYNALHNMHPVEAFQAGWGTSVTGITQHMAQGKDPNKAFEVPAHPGFANGVAQASGQLLGDAPPMIAGFFGGATAGAAVPGGGETGITEGVGGAFGAGAVPQAMREVLLDAYNRDQIHSVSDFMHVVGAGTIRTLKAGVANAPFGLAGPIGGKVAEMGGGKVASTLTGTAAATTLGVTTGAALNGKMPDAKDFMTAAATMLIAHGAGKVGETAHGVFRPSEATLHVQNNLQEIYRRNGTTPWEAINAAKGDPGLRQEILQQDVNGSSVAPRMHSIAPLEPPPAEHGTEPQQGIPAPAVNPSAEPRFAETRRDPDGTIFLNYTPTKGGKPLEVKMAVDDGVAQIAVNQFGKGANKLGPAEMRSAMAELKGMYPEITSFEGYRSSGAGAGRVQSVTAPAAPRAAPVVKTFEDLSTALEGSRDDSVSPAGAIGKHQIMLGTARQYGFGHGMGQAELAQWLHDPNNNAQVFHAISTDLHARFHGDMNAMLIAYNAGPGRAGTYLTKGPGTELEAIPDAHTRNGIRYERVPSQRDEAWLPMETQKYLANGRRRSGGATEEASAGGEGGGGPPALRVFPSEANRGPEPEQGAGGAGGGSEPPDDNPPGIGGPDGPKRSWNASQATEELMANIGEPPLPSSLLNPDRLMEQYVSELSPARNIDTALVREGGFDRNMDVGQEDMFRQTYASDTRTGAFVRFGILRIGDNKIEVVKDSPSVMVATNEVRAAGGDMRGWTAYMLARRTVEKDKQGIKTGFNLDAAKALAGDHTSQVKYDDATQTFNKVMSGGLEYGRDSGLFSQKQIDAMIRDNPAYISMRRVMGDDESFGTGTGKKGFAARDPLRKMEGSDRQIIDPIYATIDNLRVIVAMSDRNRAIGSIIGQVEQGKLEGLRLEKQGDLSISEKPGDAFKPYGLDDSAGDTYSSLLAERAQKGLSPNEFIYYRNGVAERWKATNPALVRLMKTAAGPGEVNIVGRVFDKIASLDRAGVVLDPAFPTRVTLRHQITAFIADPNHPVPFLTWMKGIIPTITQNDVWQDFVANGGANVALTDMDVNWLQRDMERTFEDQGIFNRMWNRMTSPLESYQWMSERMSSAANVGYYVTALDKGLSPLKAATAARKAYLDYAEKASLAAVNSLARKVPFLRPKILGMKQFAEAFADNPKSLAKYGAIGVLGMTVATVTLPTMLLYAANRHYDKDLPEKEKYSSIPRWIRDTHYITPPIHGARIQFPYPPVVGGVFGGLINRFLDHWVASDPHAADEWFSSLIREYNPEEMLPQAIKTPVESVTNYNFMSGHAIVPSSVEAADGYMQYTNATTEPAKAISRYLGAPGLNVANFSPMQLEHWVDGWTGPVGMGVLRAVNGRMTDYKPPSQLADLPIAGTFFVRNPDMHAQQIEDFYTDLKAMEAAHADWSLALKHGDEGEIATAARGPFYGLRIIGKIATALHVQAAAVSAVNKDTTLRPEEKSQAVDQILNSMIQLSVMGSGVTATLQGKEPSQAFKELDKSGAMATATATR